MKIAKRRKKVKTETEKTDREAVKEEQKKVEEPTKVAGKRFKATASFDTLAKIVDNTIYETPKTRTEKIKNEFFANIYYYSYLIALIVAITASYYKSIATDKFIYITLVSLGLFVGTVTTMRFAKKNIEQSNLPIWMDRKSNRAFHYILQGTDENGFYIIRLVKKTPFGGYVNVRNPWTGGPMYVLIDPVIATQNDYGMVTIGTPRTTGRDEIPIAIDPDTTLIPREKIVDLINRIKSVEQRNKYLENLLKHFENQIKELYGKTVTEPLEREIEVLKRLVPIFDMFMASRKEQEKGDAAQQLLSKILGER